MTSGGEETEWERRRRLAAIFGEGLPEVTSDEDEPSERPDEAAASERWLKSQVPPHH